MKQLGRNGLSHKETPMALNEAMSVLDAGGYRKKAEGILGKAPQKAEEFKRHYLQSISSRGWCDTEVEPILEHALCATGLLVQTEIPAIFPPELERKLKWSANRIPTSVTIPVEEAMGKVEKAIVRMKEKAADLKSNPDYLFHFGQDEDFSNEMAEAIRLMKQTRDVNSGIIANHPWVLRSGAARHFIRAEEVEGKRREISVRLGMDESSGHVASEDLTLFELHEARRKEILTMAGEKKRSIEIAKKMCGLMASQLSLLHGSIAGRLEPLNKDTDSIYAAVSTLNLCLMALVDIQQTRRIIPSLR